MLLKNHSENSLFIVSPLRFAIFFFCFLHFALTAQNIEVSGAGSSQANGIYTPNGTQNGKTQYVKTGDPNLTIYWDLFEWYIFDNNNGPLYYSSNNVATPDLATNWYDIIGSPPVPSVSASITGPALSYSGNSFTEVVENNGAIENQITITYNGFNGDFLTGSNNENYVATGKVSISNVPAGLTAQVVLTATNELTFTLTGQASAHTSANNINNLTLQFANSAFNANNAIDVFGYLSNNLEIGYRTAHTVCASGCNYTTIQSAINSIPSGDLINLASATYTEQNITISNKLIIIEGNGADQTILQASSTPNTATDRVVRVMNGHLIIKDVTIRHGKIVGGINIHGAGIWAFNSSKLEMYRCAVVDNIANNDQNTNITTGGGVSALDVTKLKIEDCLFANNQLLKTQTGLVRGGGLYLSDFGGSEQYQIINTTFSGNSLTAVNSTAVGSGSAIGSIPSKGLLINNCTFTNNTTTGSGGGIAFVNSSDTINLRNSIIFGNTATTGADYFRGSIGVVNALHNIIGVTAATTGNAINGTNTNNSNSDPLLQALANNGGSLQTHAIATGSPAIDAGGTDATSRDQRGFYKQGTRDVGAFELNGFNATGYAVWTGAESNSWGQPNNWNPLGVPTSSSNILIPASANNPISSGFIEISELVLQSNAVLTMQNNHTLLISNDLQNNGNITLQATDASNYAQLKFNGAYTGSGNVTQQQNLNAGWNLISSSMNATEASHFGNIGTNAIGATLNTRNLYSWDGSQYVNIPDNSANISPGTGYFGFVGTLGFQTAAGVTNFTGTPNTSVVSTALNFSNPASGVSFSISGSTGNQGWNLIGNPFTCALDVEALTTNNSSDIEGAIYIYNSSGPSYTSRSAGSPGNRYVAPMQAFWIKANGSNPTLGPATWTMADYGTVSQSPTRLKGLLNPIEDYFVLDVVEINNTSKKDQLVFSIAPGATDDFDSEWDARKFLNGSGMPNMYSLMNGEGMAVNSVSYAFGQNKSMDVAFKSDKYGEFYEISLNLSYLTNNFSVFLEDKALNEYHNLVLDGAYSFTHDTNFSERFVVHFNHSAIALEEFLAQNAGDFQAWVHAGQVFINIFENMDVLNLQVIDMKGSALFKEQFTAMQGDKLQLNLPHLKAGVYMLQVSSSRGQQTHKFIY